MTMHCTENRLFQQVLGFMDARELGYEAQPGEDGGLLFFQANLDSGVYQMVLSVDGREGLNQLLLFAPVAVKPPAESPAQGKFSSLHRYQGRFPRPLAHYNNQKVS